MRWIGMGLSMLAIWPATAYVLVNDGPIGMATAAAFGTLFIAIAVSR